MCIREASEKDITELNRVIRASFHDVAERYALTLENCPTHPSFCTEQWIGEAMAAGTWFFILEDGGAVCGCAALERAEPDACYLERLAVLPERRRMGHGKSLVSHVLEEARAAGALRVEIGIIAAQDELRDWYLEQGFRETGRKSFKHLPFEVAFMACRL
ncbi:MAG: GNAT family N-acetyltransferase [Actinomycetota bacterium]